MVKPGDRREGEKAARYTETGRDSERYGQGLARKGSPRATHFRYPRDSMFAIPTRYCEPTKRWTESDDSTSVRARRRAVREIGLSMMNSVRSARLRGPSSPSHRERKER